MMPGDKDQAVVPSMIDLDKHNPDSEKKTTKGFIFKQRKLELLSGNIEDLRIKSFVLPRYISSQLGLEADPSILVSHPMKKSNHGDGPEESIHDDDFNQEEEEKNSISFTKKVNFLRIQTKFNLSTDWVAKVKLKRSIFRQKSSKLTIIKRSLSVKHKTRLRPFESKHFVGKKIGEDKFIQQRIQFLNTVQPLVGSNSIPPQSTPTICKEHSKMNLSRIKNLRVDGDL
jgi:hypothetical protein